MKKFLSNKLFYVIGLGFLTLSKVKNLLLNYSTPKNFGYSELSRCVDHDFLTVDNWIHCLRNYTKNKISVAGKNILELGPGSDLGVGLRLLSKGCLKYNAIDVNNLIKNVPDKFYEEFFERSKKLNDHSDIVILKKLWEETKKGDTSKLNYVVCNDFDIITAFGKSTIDMLFSEASFEHFDDVEDTIYQLSVVCKPGAVMVTGIDLKTHSRWICDKDPNNIYRYSNNLYRFFWFRGIPNRIRPYKYIEAFERYGWINLSVIPTATIPVSREIYSGINKEFAHKRNQMEITSFILCGTKSKGDYKSIKQERAKLCLTL